jgi:hypothetical protein
MSGRYKLASLATCVRQSVALREGLATFSNLWLLEKDLYDPPSLHNTSHLPHPKPLTTVSLEERTGRLRQSS